MSFNVIWIVINNRHLVFIWTILEWISGQQLDYLELSWLNFIRSSGLTSGHSCILNLDSLWLSFNFVLDVKYLFSLSRRFHHDWLKTIWTDFYLNYQEFHQDFHSTIVIINEFKSLINDQWLNLLFILTGYLNWHSSWLFELTSEIFVGREFYRDTFPSAVGFRLSYIDMWTDFHLDWYLDWVLSELIFIWTI